MNTPEQISTFREFIEKFYYAGLLETLRKGQDFLAVDFGGISRFNPELAECFLEQPEETLAAAELGIKEFDLPKSVVKFHVRLYNLPASRRIMIRDVRSKHLNKMLWTEGVVRQKSDVRPQVTSARFECPSCGNVINVLQRDRKFKEPGKCSCGRKGKFKELSRELIDAQGIVLEEAPEDLEGGAQPKRINIFLKNDLVSPINEQKSSPGSKIRVVGWVQEVPTTLRDGGVSTKFEIILHANFVETVEEDFTNIEISKEEEEQIKALASDPKGYEKLVRSIAPSVYGHDKIKESLLLQFVGGVRKVRPDGTITRGDMHVLLVGDPGSGKSQMLKRAVKIAPKARYVTGKGVSGAGLTAAVVKDEFLGGWSLEAGALVLSNHGFVMIDEMDKMGDEDRSAMHEALEQQCYHHNTELMFADGTTEKIGSFVDRTMNAYRGLVRSENECEVLDIDLPEILTTDFSSITTTKITRVSRRKAPQTLYEITYRNGRSIVVTPEHPVFTFDGEVRVVQAQDAKEGMLAPMPRRLPTACGSEFEIDRDYGLFLGLWCSEGFSYKSVKHRYAEIGICNTDSYVNNLARGVMLSVFQKHVFTHVRDVEENDKATKVLVTSKISSQAVYARLQEEVPELVVKAPYKRVPARVKSGSVVLRENFLNGFYLGDGFVDQERVGFVTSSLNLAHDIQQLLLQFEIYSYVETDRRPLREYYKVIVSGYDSYLKFYRFVSEKDHRNVRVRMLMERSSRKNNDRDVLPTSVGGDIDALLREFHLNDGYFHKIIRGRCNVHRKTCWRYLKKVEEYIQSIADRTFSDVRELRRVWCISVESVAGSMGVSSASVYNYESRDDCRLERAVYDLVRDKQVRILGAIKRLHGIVHSDMRFVTIERVRRVENMDSEWVYDITVEPSNNFISQNLVLHNSVSIAKANIQATLRAETTVLAAANPKLGRFDIMNPIAPQIDLPPTLINRFDLIFPIKDMPNKDRDEKMAHHILGLHQEASTTEAEIPTSLLRKYIVYVRQKAFPKITSQASEEIENYYVQMRSSVGSEEQVLKAIPITPRQLDALVRLAEASAKVRLSDKVTRQDARKAIELLEYCTGEVARDTKTGKIDIDIISTGVSTSQRNIMIVLKELLIEFENEIGKAVPIEDLIERAKERKIDKEDVEDVIEKLKRQGDIFEPKRGCIQRIT